MAEAAVMDEYVQMDEVDWVDFPEGLCAGAIQWNLLHVSPEQGAWPASLTNLLLRTPIG